MRRARERAPEDARCIALAEGADLEGFRDATRRLLAEGIAPEDIVWLSGGDPALFTGDTSSSAPPVVLPRRFGDLARLVVCHRDPERYAHLYSAAWRLTHGEPALLATPSDPLVHRLEQLAKAIRRDLHKMHAFLRFRRVEAGDGPSGRERFVAWFEPDHFILDATAEFFVSRFRAMEWSILTPIGSLHWDRERLHRGPPARREDVPVSDTFEAGWSDYYAATFNPARTNLDAMRAEMPKKYWKNMPETRLIPALVDSARSRVETMMTTEPAPARKRDPAKAVAAMARQAPASLPDLNRLIAASEPLVPGATRAVLGEGPIGASLAFVGEQPGDQEDLAGRPFVGPAGQVLDRAMAAAGIDRGATYVTNAVKHFKFLERGKRRIHQKPTMGEVKHYRWWLERELEFVAPKVVVALGATAVSALAGKALPIIANRGRFMFGAQQGFITIHPSYLLRLEGEAAKEEAYRAFVADLAAAQALAT